MDRILAPNSVPFAQADIAPTTGTPQYATDGNPASNIPATQWPAYAFNSLQDEIYNVIVAAGLTPNRNAWNQLLTAIETMLQGSTTNVAADTGAANAYVVAFTPALTAPIPWVPFWIRVKTANTGASTLNATGTVEPLVGGAHLALQGGEMVANGNALVYWNPTLAAGAGSYVLLFCSGAPDQIAPATQHDHAVQFSQVSGVVGQMRNLVSVVSAAGTTKTVTADEIIVETALGGLRYCLSGLNLTGSLATQMDTGSAPLSGFVAEYVIFNPNATLSGTNPRLLYQNATAAAVPNVYGGGNPVAGYTASALSSVWATNSSGQFIVAGQQDRALWFPTITAINASVANASFTSLTIASAVPKNAKTYSGSVANSGTVATSLSYAFAGTSSGIGGSSNQGNNTQEIGGSLGSIPIFTTQTTFYQNAGGAGTINLNMGISGYTF